MKYIEILNVLSFDIYIYIYIYIYIFIIMKTVCLHNFHHNGFVVHIGCTNEPKSVQQAVGKEHNLSGGHVS